MAYTLLTMSFTEKKFQIIFKSGLSSFVSLAVSLVYYLESKHGSRQEEAQWVQALASKADNLGSRLHICTALDPNLQNKQTKTNTYMEKNKPALNARS